MTVRQTQIDDSLYARPLPSAPLEECFFYHTMELPGIGIVEGSWDLRGEFPDYTNHLDFRGKRVIDIGAGAGFLTFEAEKAGAAEVVSFDMDRSERQDYLPFQEKLWYRDRGAYARQHDLWIERWHKAYWTAHRAHGSAARAYYGDVYALPHGLGQFDIAIVGSILEHLADPIKALASIARRTEGQMVIVTPMLDTDEPIARFLGDKDKPKLDFHFWNYSRGIYRHVLGMLGFELTEINKRGFRFLRDGGKRHDRWILTATRIAGGSEPGASGSV